ncbi:hypothetical protein RB595_003436 [Gaeumannomyces hyphopodioides]
MKLLPPSNIGALAALAVPLLAVSTLAQDAPAAATLRSCLTAAGVPNIIEADGAASWAAETALFNRRFRPAPACIALPETRDQIALSLACARNASVKVTARGAAHSFAGFGYGTAGNLVVSMAAFNGTSFDADTGLLTFGGGSHVGPVAKELWDGHRRHFPHVRGSHVGLAGSSFGGGFGTTSRMWGAPVDNIVAAELMLYNGTVVTARPGSDLLFAVKGAAPSYGVILSMTTRTYAPAFATAVNFTISLGDVGVDAGARALVALQDFALRDGSPDELAARWRLEVPPYTIQGFWYGDPAAFDAAVGRPLTAALDRAIANITDGSSAAPGVAVLRSTELPFWDVEVAAAGAGMNQPGGGSLGGRAFYTQALTTTVDHPLTPALARTLMSHTGVAFNRSADLSRFGYLDLWGGAPARDGNLTDGSTAFAHGRNLWLIRWDGNAAGGGSGAGAYPADGPAYLKSQMLPFETALRDAGAPLRGFVNYPDTELGADEWSGRLYGDNFARLRRIKAAYDPEGLFFSHAQSIPLP